MDQLEFKAYGKEEELAKKSARKHQQGRRKRIVMGVQDPCETENSIPSERVFEKNLLR